MRIGFVDYDLNRSHANTFLSIYRGPLADAGIEIAYAWEMEASGDDWCGANQVMKCGSIAQVAEQSEGIMILAPDNIDLHVMMFEETAKALSRSKPVYVDKCLHTAVEGAKRIVALAEQKRIPLATGSALRFAVELEKMLPEMEKVQTCTVRGYGPMWQYALHTISLGMRILGSGVTRVINTGTEEEGVLTADFGDRKLFAQIVNADNATECFPWTFAARCAPSPHSGARYVHETVTDPAFYQNLLKAVAGFLKTGESYITVQEMIDTVAILDLAEQSRKAGGTWIHLK